MDAIWVTPRKGYQSNYFRDYFFGLITPYSVVIRIFGRDELYLRRSNNKSHWINRSQSSPQTDFKRQF